MANILTAAEAANTLRCDETDPAMLDLLPSVDAYIRMATGRDWAADNPVRAEAKSAARMLLTMWHENPAMLGQAGSLSFGLQAALLQLETLALMLGSEPVPADALQIVSAFPSDGAVGVAVTANLVVIFNHEMAAAATTAATLRDGSGSTVTTTNSLDVTGKILMINPASSLAAASSYALEIDAAADRYGMTLTTTIRFETA